MPDDAPRGEDDEIEDDDELDDIDDEDYEDDALERTAVTVEVTGLSLYTHHGVTEAERDVGQRLILDLRFDAGACDATVTDRVEDTVDYARVCEVVSLAAQRRSYRRSRRCAPRSPTSCWTIRRERGLGQGDEAGAADRAPGGVRLGRGLALAGRGVAAPTARRAHGKRLRP